MNYYGTMDVSNGGGSSVTVDPLSIVENGTYTAEEGKAFSPVTVNVEIELPALTMPASPDDVASGKEFIDGNGEKQTGIFINYEDRIVDGTISGDYVNNRITKVRDNAFQNSTYLMNVTLLNCEIVGNSSFKNCAQLNSVTMSNVSEINAQAFYECSLCSLYDFRGASSVPILKSANAFYSKHDNVKFVVPDSLYNDWQNAPNWVTYKTYIVKESDYIA